MRCTAVMLALSALGFAAASCPGMCSGHGYCTKDDKCLCYHTGGLRASESFAYIGADCAKRTCPKAQAWGDISDEDAFVPTVVFAGGDSAASQDFLRITVDPQMNALAKNLQYTLSVLNDGSGTAYFQYQLLNEKASVREATSHPIPVASHTSLATALHLKYLNTQATGVYVHWDEAKAPGTLAANLKKGDEYSFVVPYNYALQANGGDSNTAHGFTECAGRGACDYTTGTCKCDAGYTGDACQRKTCPKACSGHGVCQSLQRSLKDVGDAGVVYSSAFDAAGEVLCLCDAGYRGMDCSQMECPSKADPMGGFGANGNNRDRLAGPAMDCSGRGTCDYASGTCSCYDGFNGGACERVTAFV